MPHAHNVSYSGSSPGRPTKFIMTLFITIFLALIGVGLLFLIVLNLSSIVEQIKLHNSNTCVVHSETVEISQSLKRIANNSEPVAKMAKTILKRFDDYA